MMKPLLGKDFMASHGVPHFNEICYMTLLGAG